MPTKHLLSCYHSLWDTVNISVIHVVRKGLSDLKDFVYLHRALFQFLHQFKKPVDVFLAGSFFKT